MPTISSLSLAPSLLLPPSGDVFPTLALMLDTGDPTVASPTWTDITAYLAPDGITVRHGRQFELDLIETGTSSVALENIDRRFDPTYTAGAYYPNVKPMRRMKLQATWDTTTYDVFTHYIERWPPHWEGPDWSQVTVTGSDGFLVLKLASLVLSRSAELSGTRIGAVLDAVGWPAAARTIDVGQSQVPSCVFADADAQTALAHIQDVAAGEDGLFFIDGSGNAVFQDRSKRQKATTSRVTLTDDNTAVSASVLSYDDAATSYDLDHLYNDVKGQRDGGAVQIATDSGSQTSFYRRSLVEQSLQLTTDAEVLSRAQYRLSRYKQPSLRVDSVTVKPCAENSVATLYWPHILSREISDRVTFKRTPPTHPVVAAETISFDCFIEAVEHVMRPAVDWTTTYLLSPADPQTYWIAGDTVASRAGTTTRAGY